MRLNHPQGCAAEARAWEFLQAQGFTLVARNWHCRYGEIDLIVRKPDLLLFVEVKYRSGTGFGGTAYSITPAKLGKLARSVECYLQAHPTRLNFRIDALLFQGAAAPQWLHNITEGMLS